MPDAQALQRKVESCHSMLAATVVALGHAMALPLMPEFIAPQDGAEKQDCERNAVRRWLATHGNRALKQKVAGRTLIGKRRSAPTFCGL